MSSKKIIFTLISFLFAASYFFERTNAVAVMSVDIGSEWFKVAIVSPGVPMEIALNKESKRKTPMTISFRGDERTFGEEAQIAGIRSPKTAFSYFLDLVGKSIDNPIVQLFRERFPHYEIESDEERNTIMFRANNQTFTPEELLAQILIKSREFAQNSANQKINEAVITVPAFFNQAERRAILQAAELANLKVLQLFNVNTAVALNYGIFRKKEMNETSHYVMFYDMGAGSTTATLVEYQNAKSKDKSSNQIVPQVTVLGVGYDRTLGGLEMQMRLRNYLGQEYDKIRAKEREEKEKKTGKPQKEEETVFKNERAMAKLFKEAGRVKDVLSANNEHYAQIEGLVDEHDFRLHVTRDTLEELCEDLFKRVGNPIKMALDASGLTMDIISQIVLVGAGTRMPRVQDTLREITKTELAKNMNTDESAVLGAVYKAADLSQGFKVKKFVTKDAILFPIQIAFDRNVDGKNKQVRKMLFSKVNTYPQKRTITFNKHREDFEFSVQYAELDHLPVHEQATLGNHTLSHVRLSGVSDALEKHAAQKAESKGIKAHFSMDDSGILHLQHVELVSEKSAEAGAGEEEGSDENDGAEKVENQKEDVKPAPEEVPEVPNADADQGEKVNASNQAKPKKEKATNQTSEKVDKKPIVTTISLKIDATEIKFGPKPLEGEKLKQSQEKINNLIEIDLKKARRETALNTLESFVVETKHKLDTDEHKSVVTEEELAKIIDASNKVQDWLYDEGFDADAEVYEKELQKFKKLTDGLYERVYEHRERPEVLKATTSIINGSSIFLMNMRNLTDINDIIPPEELETLEKVINETQLYYEKVVAWTESASRTEPVKYKVQDIANKMTKLDYEVKYLVNKAKKWRPKPEAKPEVKNATVEVPPVEANATSESQPDKVEPTLEKDENTTRPVEEESSQAKLPQDEKVEIPETAEETDTSEKLDEQDDETSHQEL